MSKDQIVKPAVTTAVAAAAANTMRAMQSRISLPSHAETLTETSLRALDEAHFICNDDTEVRTLFPLTLNPSPLPFMVLHTDVWGLSKVTTFNGSRWFVTFIDDCTRMT